MTKQYADRDITSEELMDLYMTHVDAMTGEDLHSKSDIAAELAYRDARIKDLENQSEAEALVSDSYRDERNNALERIISLLSKLEMQQEAYRSLNKELDNALERESLLTDFRYT